MKCISHGVLLLPLGAVLLGASVRAQETPLPAVAAAADAGQAAAASYEISGAARSGKTPLPGATVSAANTLTGKKFAAVTNAEGKFELRGMARGRYVVRIEFMGFATFTQEVVLNPENLSAKVDAELLLASRQQQQTAGGNAALAAMGRGFQSLALDSSLSSMGGGPGNGDLASLPLNGAGVDAPTESVSVSGAQGQTQEFGGGSEEEMQERMREFRERMQREGGGPGGGGGGHGGGPGMIGMGGMRRGLNINQPHGVLYFSNDNAALDARSYSLTGIPAEKPGYNQGRFGANVGGPLRIPGIFDGGGKWFFFAGWNGQRGSAPYDVFSTVPTASERGGDFSNSAYRSGLPVQIFDPQTGLPYQFNGVLNQIDPALISPAANSLLQYIPLPNMAASASGQNVHYVTSSASNSDALNLRIVHNFGAGGGPGFGPFGGGGGRGARNNINMGLNWSRNSSDIVNPFPSLAGGTGTQGLNASAGWVYGKGRATNMFRVNYNHYHVSVTNLYSNFVDTAGPGGAGITGISSDPFDWGLPGISFTSFAGLSDPTPRRELDQTYTLSDTVSWNRGKHNLRFGGDYRRILQSFRSARNAEGKFVFTGFATSQYAPGGTQPLPGTGDDFADFLLGFPQQTSLQFGASSYNFRANAFNLFSQDDWRFRPNLSFNLGLRYEYTGPYTEAQNRIANLDVAAGFSAAAPVLPGQTGPYSGTFPASLVRPDRNNFAPRVGIAWRPDKKTVVRAGYGINYNLAQYGVLIQNFAFQPPFANTATNVTDVTGLTGGTPLTLVNGFPAAAGSTVTNNFGVAPDYRLGYAQIWNLDVQRELRGGVILSAGYNGAKGTRLDTQRALAIAGGQPFLYESSEGNSILHAASIRVRKRMAHGIGLSAQYVFSKSLDNASSIGGGGSVVAQDPSNISADRGHSSFDQTHKFTGNWSYELPLGETHRFAQKGFQRKLISGWQWNGDFTAGSGAYFTPRVLGGGADISRGASGSLRANRVAGQPLSTGNPTTLEWFNTAAFCAPSATCVNSGGSSFGDAARNSIEGPGQWVINMSMSRTIPFKESRALELRITANNVFNAVRFTALNTAVNSLTYGEVTGTGDMRRITLQARLRF
ncbi:MAG: TonB-dependent receptor [Acidobacteriia bacterium]|nr:TonB-dependent receptor [Terriglobia bacterium]